MAKRIHFIIILLLVGCFPGTNLEFDDWDKNDSGNIEPDEFKTTYSAHFYDDWNDKDNAYLDDDGFIDAVFKRWDLDKDGALNFPEWQRGYDYYYGDHVSVSFENIASENDKITREKFRNVRVHNRENVPISKAG